MCGVCGVAVFVECVSWWRGPNLEGAVQQGQATKSTGRKGHPHAPGALQSISHALFLPSRQYNERYKGKMTVSGDGPRQQLVMELRGCERGAAHVLVAPTRAVPVGFERSPKKRWDGRHGFVITGESQFQGSDFHWGSLGLAGARWGSQLPPGSQGRQGPTRTALEGGRWLPLDSAWTASGADVYKPRPPAVPRIGGPPPPVRQDPQASTAANPLDGLQATAKAPSFTSGSRLVQLLGLLD